MTLESQAWWRLDGITVPTAVGEHIHVRATIPRDGVIVDGRVDVPVVITLHDQVRGPNWIRWSDGSNVIGRIDLDGFNGFSCVGTNCTRSLTLPIDFSDFGTGRRELRISANVPDEQRNASGSQRMFNSTGWQVCVRSCSPSYRSGDFIEARGWYDDSPAGVAHGYQNARLTSPVSSVRSGGTIGVKLAPGSGGLATTYSGVFIDPNFHAGNPGTVVRTANGPMSGSVTLPTLPSGSHTLVLVASDGQNAGVLAVPFVVP